MRIGSAIVLVALAACSGSSDPKQKDSATAAKPIDAAVHDDMSSPDAPTPMDAADAIANPPPELEALVGRAVAAYDRVSMARCECVVEHGGYDSVEECFEPIASSPEWVSCGTRVLAANDSPDVLIIAQCIADEMDVRAECLSTTECDSDKHSTCDSGISKCASNPPLLLMLLQECPDLALLSR